MTDVKMIQIFISDGSGKFCPLLYSRNKYGSIFPASCSHTIGKGFIIYNNIIIIINNNNVLLLLLLLLYESITIILIYEIQH